MSRTNRGEEAGVDPRAAAVDAVANALTSAVLGLDLALIELAAEDLPPRARSAVTLLKRLSGRLGQLGPELTRLSGQPLGGDRSVCRAGRRLGRTDTSERTRRRLEKSVV